MSLIENPQKKSLDQKLFAAGMVLAFIGLLLPSFSFPDWVKGGTSNVLSAAAALNQPGFAYNATFIVVFWLAALSGIAVFLLSHSLIGEILVWFIGAGFGLAATITLPKYLEVAPVVGYASIGSYLACIGWTLALVAWVIGASKVKQAGIRKEI